ncbi:MAG: MXAN_5187 C-terminal domain-containing protein [Terriglobia bacterium]
MPSVPSNIDFDQALDLLEDGVRRLKIEYEIFFNGGSKKVPYDLRWRVESLIKRYGDFSKLSFAQRFRYNTLVARFHSYNELWRRLLKNKEEGKLSYQSSEYPDAEILADGQASQDRLICQLVCRDPETEEDKVQNLFKSLLEAKRECGENPETLQFDSFKKFVLEKTAKLKSQFKCDSVCYVISVESGRVKLVAKGKT